MLRLEDVSKRYEQPPRWLRPLLKVASAEPVDAVRSVSFEVAPGEVVGLVGPNGAGKTTLIKMIMTLCEPSAGRISIDGLPDPVERRRRIGVVLVDDRGFYWRLTGRQNLEFFGVLSGLTRRAAAARAGEMLVRFGLADRDKLVFGYSSGMRTSLNMARSLMADPPYLVLDEPTRSLDPVASEALVSQLRVAADAGCGILLASHRLDELTGIADRIVALVDGQIRFVGTPTDLGEGTDERSRRLVGILSQEDHP